MQILKIVNKQNLLLHAVGTVSTTSILIYVPRGQGHSQDYFVGGTGQGRHVAQPKIFLE